MRRQVLIATFLIPSLTACINASDAEVVVDPDVGTVGAEILTGYIAGASENETLESQMMSSGVTGYVGNTDGTVNRLNIRIDNSDPQNPVVYVARDGDVEVGYTVVGEPDGNTLNLETSTGDPLTATFASDADAQAVAFGPDAMDGAGTFGIQTPLADLTFGTLTYIIAFNAEGQTDTTSADMRGLGSLNVHFGESTVIGTIGGVLTATNAGIESTGNVSGTITGDTSGNEVIGQISWTGDATGTFDLLGAPYGENGDRIAGGLGGSVTFEAENYDMGGAFNGAIRVIIPPT